MSRNSTLLYNTTQSNLTAALVPPMYRLTGWAGRGGGEKGGNGGGVLGGMGRTEGNWGREGEREKRSK